MTNSSSDRHSAFMARFQQICTSRIAPDAGEADTTGKLPPKNWDALIGAGYFKLFHSPEVGGLGADGALLGTAMETLGRACASTLWSATVSTALCGKLLFHLGRPHHQSDWLAPILEGRKIGCVAGTEHGSGSDQRSYQTKLRPQGGRWMLSGEKLRVTNAPIADVAIVLAQIETAQAMEPKLAYAVVDLCHPRVKRSEVGHMGLRAMPWGNLSFDQVELAEEDIISDATLDKVLRSIEWGLLLATFCSVGIASAAFSACLDYVKTRQAFDRPIAHLQVIHSRLAEMHAEIEGARLLGLDAASVMANGQIAGERAMMAKINATEMAIRVTDAAMKIFAGWGFSTEFPIERFYRDAVGSLSAGLTPDRLRELLVARDLDVDPWTYEPFDWLTEAGLNIPA